MKRILLFIFTIFILFSCRTIKLAEPTQTDVDRGSKIFPDLTLTELNQGKAIFEKNCHLCHKLKEPTLKNEDQWRKLVPIMVGRVNKKKKVEIIDSQSKEILLRYLITMSTATV